MANMGLNDKPVKNQIRSIQNDDKKAGKQQSNFRVLFALGLITQLGLIIGVMTAGGVFLGRWADGEDGTGVFTVIGVVLGLTAGLLSGYRLIKRTLR